MFQHRRLARTTNEDNWFKIIINIPHCTWSNNNTLNLETSITSQDQASKTIFACICNIDHTIEYNIANRHMKFAKPWHSSHSDPSKQRERDQLYTTRTIIVFQFSLSKRTYPKLATYKIYFNCIIAKRWPMLYIPNVHCVWHHRPSFTSRSFSRMYIPSLYFWLGS